MNRKSIKIPSRLQLKPGTHIIMPGSTKGGAGKSSTIITIAGGCKLVGLPYIVATFDQTNSALERALGDNVVVALDAQTPELARKTLSEVTKQAREHGAIILLDFPGAFSNKENTLLENIQRARVLERCDSLSLVVPISPDAEELEGGISAIKIFEPDNVLLRTRKPTRHAPSFESFEKPWGYLKQYPLWDCEQWTQSMKEIFTHSGEYAGLPPVPTLPSFLKEHRAEIPQPLDLDIEDVVYHLETAAAAIYEHILQPITTSGEVAKQPTKETTP